MTIAESALISGTSSVGFSAVVVVVDAAVVLFEVCVVELVSVLVVVVVLELLDAVVDDVTFFATVVFVLL